MKASEAKTKVCPFMEVFIDENSVAFETMDNKNSYCICGDCMAWEYTKSRKGGYHNDSAKKWVETGAELPEEEKEGYCKRLGQ